MPWTSYFTIFANLLYITACLKGMTDRFPPFGSSKAFQLTDFLVMRLVRTRCLHFSTSTSVDMMDLPPQLLPMEATM